MRSLLLFLVIMIVTPSALILPHLGVLVWSWISIMNPHRLSWGFSESVPFVMIIACVTLVAWLFSKEPKLPPSRLLTWAAFAFLIQTTISTTASLHPATSWLSWEQTLKTFVLFFTAAALVRTRVRIQALLWIIAISLGFYATRGVMNTLSSGGNTVLAGPMHSMIRDNNHLALSLVVLLPILNYLRVTSANALVRTALTMVMVFTVVSVITSYSRGGLISLGVAGLGLMRPGRGRIVLVVLLAAVTISVVNVMPDKWKERVFTLESVDSIQEDASFSSRVDAWVVSWKLATSRPLTGGGFRVTEHLETFLQYYPEATRGRAAHSIYFQVLGEHGFSGLILYLTMVAAAWFHLRRTAIRARRHAAGLVWAGHLAKMLQVSIVCFMVGAAALSVAYHDLILLILVVSMNVDIISKKAVSASEPVNLRHGREYQFQ